MNNLLNSNLLIILICFFIITITSMYFKYHILCHTSIRPKIYVSLTTTPNRIGKIKNTIDSILNQTVQYDSVILNIPYSYNRNPDLKFDKFQDYLINNNKIIINFTEDLGPATKIIPTCKLPFIGDNDIIFSIDDDIIYPNYYIEKFLMYHLLYPNCCITGLSNLTYNNDKFHPLKECLLVNGYSCVLYIKKFLKDINLNLFDFNKVPLYVYLSDDIVISDHLKNNGVPIITLNSKDINILEYGLTNDALHKGAGINDKDVKDNETKYIKTIQYLKSKGNVV